MFIAFDGPDNTGKSTTAANLASDGVAIYNVTKDLHRIQQEAIGQQPDDVITYDRIDWFTHMVYRLSMPDRDWNDDRPRTVFAMPDTHLVIKLHRPDLAPMIDDELYERGKLALVNPMYFYFADFLSGLNRARDYALFKTVSIMEVSNDPRDGSFSQRLMAFDSPVTEFGPGGYPGVFGRLVESDEDLLEWLRYEESQR